MFMILIYKKYNASLMTDFNATMIYKRTNNFAYEIANQVTSDEENWLKQNFKNAKSSVSY